MNNFIKISKCGKFLMSESMVYSAERNKSYNIKDLGIGFWIHIMKENSLRIVEENINNISKINKLLNETVFKFSDLFNDQSLIIEFHKTNGGLILAEGFGLNNYKTTIENSWEFFNDYLVKNELISEEDSWLERTWDKTKEYAGKAYEKVKSAVSWIKEKGVSWFFESLRAALFSWGGAAIQAFLATAGSLAFGLGPSINFIVWAAMLCYDVYLGISTGSWNWVYIIIDILGTFTAGPGAKIAHGIFKGVGLIGKGVGGTIQSIIKKLGTTSGGQKLSGMFKNVVSGLSTLLGYVTQAIKWIGEKLGLKYIVNAATSIKNWISKVVGEVSAAFKTSSVGQAVNATGQAVNATGQAVKATGQAVSRVAKTGKTAYSNLSTGQKALASAGLMGGVTAGLNTYTGSDNSAFAGAFSKEFMTPEQKQSKALALMASSDAEFPEEDMIGGGKLTS